MFHVAVTKFKSNPYDLKNAEEIIKLAPLTFANKASFMVFHSYVKNRHRKIKYFHQKWIKIWTKPNFPESTIEDKNTVLLGADEIHINKGTKKKILWETNCYIIWDLCLFFFFFIFLKASIHKKLNISYRKQFFTHKKNCISLASELQLPRNKGSRKWLMLQF